jgi:hypothetical protein
VTAATSRRAAEERACEKEGEREDYSGRRDLKSRKRAPEVP